MIRRLVNAYPINCKRDWMTISQVKTDDGTPDIDINIINTYLSNLKKKPGRMSAKSVFSEASRIARHHGDAYVLMGVADGLEPNEPINYNNIQSLEWLKVISKYYVIPKQEGNRGKYSQHPEFYEVTKTDQVDGKNIPRLWHHSRVLRFKGNEVVDESSLAINGGHNDSVIQSFYEVWLSWHNGIMAGSAMLADYDQAVYKFKGLGQALAEDKRRGNRDNQEAIRQRLLTADIGRSVAKALLIDMDDEDFMYHNRNYGGAEPIMKQLKEALISEVDTPNYIIFNTTNAVGTSLSTNQTAGLAQRYDWVGHKNNWMEDNWVDPLAQLMDIVIVAKDAGINREFPYKVKPAAQVILTPVEQLQVQTLAAQRDDLNINSTGIYSALTAQSAYTKAEWTPEIEIVEDDLLEL
jgi:hypothetical protein